VRSLEELQKEYQRRTPTSLKCFERAKKSFQGGVASNFQAFDPYPIFWDHAKGSKFWDVDQSNGIPKGVTEGTIVVPFNNIDAMRDALKRNRGEVAAVIVEPIMMNCALIPPKDGYLQQLRELTKEYDVVLIFDEVKTGFKVAWGGACEYYHIKPDLVTLGKCIGSGFSLGAFGGKKEIMEHLKAGDVAHGGTYSANPLAVRASITALREILTKENLEYATKLENKLVDGLKKAMKDNGIPGFVNSIGPCGMVFFTQHEIYDFRSNVKYYNAGRLTKYWHGLVNNGVWIAPHTDEHWTVSVQHTEEDIEKTLAVIRKIMPDVK